MECYACTNEATRQCRRCARVYCEVHGGDACAECLSPASALPSFNLYRGSLLALLVGTAVAIWLLVQPPGQGSSRLVVLPLTPTISVTEVISTPTPELEPTPEGETSPEPRPYVVETGDTLFDIAERFAPPGVEPAEYAEQIAAASGLSSVNDPLNPGDELVLP